MPIRISNLRLSVAVPETELPRHLARRLGLNSTDLQRWRILKKSLDARSSSDLQFVYTTLVELADASAEVTCASASRPSDVQVYEPPQFEDADPGSEPMSERPIIVGSGPAGLLAGYYLALKGYRPIILERGEAVKNRVPTVREFDRGGEFDRENNYLFGEGGAGCFSDGKLTCRLEGPDVEWVLQSFVECGGRPSLVYENRPHLGSNKLPMICRNYRRKIEALGGEYKFGCRFEGLQIRNGQVIGIETSSGPMACHQLILGIGHSARDTYQMLYDLGVPMVQKSFQLGLRIEQPQVQINHHKYGRPEYESLLGAADYTLQARGEKDVFTFCMCAGGIIMPSISEPRMFCSNGMSNSRHDTPFANSGVMVTLEPQEFGGTHPLAGMHLQQRYEALAYEIGRGNYFSPIQTAHDFVKGRPADLSAKFNCSYQRGVQSAQLDHVLPPVVAQAIRQSLPIMDKKMRGALLKHAILVGPEMRGSSPIRIDRDLVTRQCPNIAGLYPVGEGAGYAGGIVSAAVDGLRSARHIVQQYRIPG
ncbi:NAD(P)/FAD-dependent oxidoreductase [Schlesneria paludicola]|uniref:NAD(P)/FAD-dependent oxidoreductase n=1 Tax=Schlesneria paludicola TaxID=360056 RepID=UPI00029ACD3D|nr:NAD(P)-binding protein [Schlesneria paludicola]